MTSTTSTLSTGYFSDSLSSESWNWETRLNSYWRDMDTDEVDSGDDKSSDNWSSISLPTKHAELLEKVARTQKSHVIKRVVKKCMSVVRTTFSSIQPNQVYQIKRKASIRLLHQVQLLAYKPIDDKLHPIDALIQYAYQSGLDISKVRKNSRIRRENNEVMIQDAIFTAQKLEQLKTIENKLRNNTTNSEPPQKKKTIFFA